MVSIKTFTMKAGVPQLIPNICFKSWMQSFVDDSGFKHVHCFAHDLSQMTNTHSKELKDSSISNSSGQDTIGLFKHLHTGAHMNTETHIYV